MTVNGLTTPEIKTASKCTLEMLKQVFEAEAGVLRQWRETFSIEVGDVAASQLALQQNFLGSNVNGPIAARSATGQILVLPEGVTAEHIALAQMEVRKSREYDLDLVNDFQMLAPGEEAEKAEHKQKPKPH